jgi:hypothetical protein
VAVSGRRIATVVTAAVGAAIALAAIVDAIEKAHEAPRATVHPARLVARQLDLPRRSALAAALREEHASGTLYLVDRRCVLHALRLPGLHEAPAPRARGCSALVSPATPPPGWSVWPADATLAAWCDEGRVLVAAPEGALLPMIGGCAPAWKPDGSITYVRRGAIVQFPRTGRAQVVLSAAELAHALGSSHADRVAWLGPNRLAVTASAGAHAVLAVFTGKRVSEKRDVAPGIGDLRASPRGTYLATRSDSDVRVYDTRRGLRLVRGTGARDAVAWSPDERWRAFSTPAGVVLASAEARVVLPVGARDLAWTR